MSDTPATPIAESPVEIDRVERVRRGRVRVVGRWLGPGDPDDYQPLLVIKARGARYRFPARRAETKTVRGEGETWEASFEVPPWVGPELGTAALWIGTAYVPLGDSAASHKSGGRRTPARAASWERTSRELATGAHERGAVVAARVAMPPPLGEASAWPAPDEPDPAYDQAGIAAPTDQIDQGVAPAAGDVWPPAAAVARTTAQQQPMVESGRTGPLAELLFKESVAALHGELEQRAAEEARLRAALATAEAQLRARTAVQSELETAHGALRHELQELMAAVATQREESERRRHQMEDELAAAVSERDELRERVEVELARASNELEAERDRALQQLEAERGRALAQVESERERALAQLDAERTRSTHQVADALEAADREAQAAARLRDQLAAALSAAERHAGDAAVLRERLATATVARESALGEAAGLRAELERIGAELALAQEQVAAHGGDLGEAERLLADARALAAQLRGE